MPKPSEIITATAALMNDAAQTNYTNAACLPFFNMSLDILQELYELNGIPITNKTSAIITVKSGVNSIGQDTTPALPSDFIELQELWESPSGINQFRRVDKREFIPHYIEDGTQISQFLIYAWEGGRITLVAANQDNDLKLDYTASVFNTPILIKDIDVNLPYSNIKTFLEFETAALCAMFVAENPTRATTLNNLAGDAISRALGIPIKGMQSVVTRRLPFRYSWKRRGVTY